MRVAIVSYDKPKTVAVTQEFLKKIAETDIVIDEENPNLVISIGGDGTLISAFHRYSHLLDSVRFIGIHTGHLGFYTDWRDYELDELLEGLKKDQGDSSSYPLLDVCIRYRNKKEIKRVLALNEVVLKKINGTMVCDIYVKDELFETFRGDGICVATPTGSTGTNKSLGGAVIHPCTEALQLTEMASVNNRVYRTLSSPMIIAKDEWIVVRPTEQNGLILAIDNLTYENQDIEQITYRVAKERIHFALYRHMHFWNRVENSFIGNTHKKRLS